MKRCLQCNKVFEDSIDFCLDDGTVLTEETFVLPTETSIEDVEEEKTIVHHEPLKVEIRRNRHSESGELIIPTTASEAPVIIEKTGSLGKYLFFLLLGLFLGGIIVIGALWVAYSRINAARESSSETQEVFSGKHNSRNETRKDSEFNGFVLSENANIRLESGGKVLDTLPENDRLNILEREDAWYRVVCEHGTGGWMHGNTIRFKDGEKAFEIKNGR